MKLSLTLSSLLLGSSLALASSLAVYRDSTFYTFSPKEGFIGFVNSSVTARCKGRVVAMETRSDCAKENRLCKALSLLKESEHSLKAVEANIAVLNTFISLPQPTSLDAEQWIDAAKRIGSEQARLLSEEAERKERYGIAHEAFKKQAPSLHPRYLKQRCAEDVVLELPYGQVSFSTFYEARIAKPEEIAVTQYLLVTNRSGIDIDADEALFHYRSARHYISPVHFSPWIIRKYEPQTERTFVKKAARSMVQADEAMVQLSANAAPAAPVAAYLSAREYRVNALHLPSTGEPVDVKVTQWKAPMECTLRAYPYRNSSAFTVCSFKPKTQIENNRWKVRSKEGIVNDQAVGEYDGETYRLYTATEPDVKIVRKPLVKKERTTGIFGNTVRKRDGYTLTITNKSEKAREMIVTERIPTSSTEEIKVKLLAVKARERVDYRVLKEGKIEMRIPLKAKESKTIEVLFEISYEKGVKVRY